LKNAIDSRILTIVDQPSPRIGTAIDDAREAIALVDQAGHIVVANRQFGAFFPALVVGASIATAPPPLRADADDPSAGEFQLDDGRWLRVGRSAARDGSVLLVLSDISDAKERERRARVETEEAQAESRAKSSFLANMSHELRTPLNAVIGFSEIMSGEMFGPLGDRHYRQYAADILQSGQHLLAVINSVLDLAKSEAGKLQINAEPCDLGAILADCVAMMREQSARAGLTLDAGPLDTQVIVAGEPAKLRQIFLNLLSNAIKFTDAGGRVMLSADAASAGHIAVTVADNGIGMTNDDVAVALAPFGQVDNRLARRYEGTGLGLPLANAMVELHGGTLAITSAPEVGTRVTVTLPTVAAPQG
jgi:signal transduction histidine kinase